MTKLGRLVKAGKIQSMEQIYLHSLPIKEYQIVDWFLPKLKDEVMKVGRGRSALLWTVLTEDHHRSSLCRSRPVRDSEHASRPSS